MNRKLSVLFSICFFVFCSGSAMADTITTGMVDIDAGAAARATIIGAKGGNARALATGGTGVSSSVTGPSSAVTGPSSAQINGVTAATGPSVSGAQIGEVKNDMTLVSNGSPGFPGAAQIPGTQLIQNFGPVHKVWNVISQEELRIILKLSPEGWDMKQAKALVMRKAKSYSRKIIGSLPANNDKIQVFFVPFVSEKDSDKIDKIIEEAGLVKVAIISCRGDEKNDSYDVLGSAMCDTGKMGGKALILTCLDGQLRTESDGWGIGVGGLRSSISGADNGLGSSGYGGTGYAEAGNEYVGKPFARGFACIANKELPKAKSVSQVPAPGEIWIDDSGMPHFPWEQKAYGAGVYNGSR